MEQKKTLLNEAAKDYIALVQQLFETEKKHIAQTPEVQENRVKSLIDSNPLLREAVRNNR